MAKIKNPLTLVLPSGYQSGTVNFAANQTSVVIETGLSEVHFLYLYRTEAPTINTYFVWSMAVSRRDGVTSVINPVSARYTSGDVGTQTMTANASVSDGTVLITDVSRTFNGKYRWYAV